MKRFAILAALAILPLACATHRAGQTKSTSTPGRGAIKLTITPNPVIATNVGGDTYEFPFDVVVKETGGHPVTTPFSPADIGATVYHVLGVDPTTEVQDRQNRPVKLNQGSVMHTLFTGTET